MNRQSKLAIGSFLSISMLFTSSVSVLASEAPTAAPAAKKPGDKTLRINLVIDPPTLDPALADDSTSGAIARAAFDGLTRIGKDGKVHNSVAEKVDVSPDLKTYTFHLRSSQWSNGDPVTAYDFEYAWKRVVDPRTAANYAYMMYAIKNAEQASRGEVKLDEVGVKALDDRTLQVTLEQPTPYFLELTAFHTYFPVNKKVVEANPKWAGEVKTLVGNGPFKVEAWAHRDKLTLVKNQKYWDKDAVKLDRIEGAMIEDENVEMSMFEDGLLDWAGQPLGNLPQDVIPVLKKEGKLITQPFAGVYWYKFNTEQAPFNNAKIRKAFSYAINRQAVIDKAALNNPLPATAVVPLTMTLKDGGYFKDNDTETAKKLLAEGMKELGISKLPPITVSYNTSESHKKIAEAIRDQWKQALGVEVKLESTEWKVYLENMHTGNYQIGRLGWLGDFNDPINYLEMFESKTGGNNDTRWENQKYQELLKQSATEADAEKRKKLLTDAEAILMDEMPVMPIYFYSDAFVKKEYVKDYVIDGLNYIDWKWTSVE